MESRTETGNPDAAPLPRFWDPIENSWRPVSLSSETPGEPRVRVQRPAWTLEVEDSQDLTPGMKRVTFTGVNSSDDFIRLSGYLQKLSVVRRSSPIRAPRASVQVGVELVGGGAGGWRGVGEDGVLGGGGGGGLGLLDSCVPRGGGRSVFFMHDHEASILVFKSRCKQCAWGFGRPSADSLSRFGCLSLSGSGLG